MIVINLSILKAILNLEKILWVGINFCIANGEMAWYVQRMLLKHAIAPEIVSTIVGLTKPLGITADSPLQFLND